MCGHLTTLFKYNGDRLVSEFGNNMLRKLSGYACYKQMETKVIPWCIWPNSEHLNKTICVCLVLPPIDQHFFLIGGSILFKASCFMELALENSRYIA
jgi:hypothetical protein